MRACELTQEEWRVRKERIWTKSWGPPAFGGWAADGGPLKDMEKGSPGMSWKQRKAFQGCIASCQEAEKVEIPSWKLRLVLWGRILAKNLSRHTLSTLLTSPIMVERRIIYPDLGGRFIGLRALKITVLRLCFPNGEWPRKQLSKINAGKCGRLESFLWLILTFI